MHTLKNDQNQPFKPHYSRLKRMQGKLRAMSEHHLTETRFSDLAVDPRILRGLDETGFEFCTPIQAESLPIALKGKDVAGEAQTGTGKTAAFALPILQRLTKGPLRRVRALVPLPRSRLIW